ncbi:OmpP1/FadL family transporter [Pelagibacterium sp.]|uniref:OmpP1/FadL family transporter n=1 Tax=Pelagibacterium sp. TaxID=1967288 RepID=UPI003A924AD0
MRAPRKRVHILALGGLLAASSAQAGGLEANGYNWDMIFDPATYAAKATITHVDIDQPIANQLAAPGATVSNTSNRVHYNAAIRGDLIENASCLVSAQNPFGSGTERNFAYAAGTRQAVSEKINSTDLGLTCAYGVDVGGGVVSVIGGLSAQSLTYDAVLPVAAPNVTAPIAIDGQAMGWRVGVAYEMEEIALRVAAIYNAPINYNLSGTAFGAPATASVTTPQSIELKAQSGIAPGWLVLGSIKWVDWSVIDTLTVNNPVRTVGTTLNYRDGWTVTGGVGHALTADLTVLGTLTWDRGTSSVNAAGVLENGHQTDRWGVTLGAAYDLAENVEFSGGVSYSTIAAGSNLQNETWDRGSVLAISASLKASF